MCQSFRRTWCVFIFLFLYYNLSFAQDKGFVIEQNYFNSDVLNKSVAYSIYLPPDYYSSERSYPVVYLLHGFGSDNNSWIRFGEINRLTDKAIDEGKISPMVIIMPDAGTSWYINSYDKRTNYEDFFINEFIPAMENEFKIIGNKRYRGIAGLSMGGYGSLLLSMKHPDLFSASAAFSSAVVDDQYLKQMPEKDYELIAGSCFGKGLKGSERLSDIWYNNSVLEIANNKSFEELTKVRYWIDCGDKDFLIKGNCLLHIILFEREIPHEFRVREGAHTWCYWRNVVIDAFEFFSINFRGN